MSAAAGDVDAGTPGAAAHDDADVTVVVVTYEGRHLVDACLRGLADQELGPYRMRVVLVDNASTDGTAEHVAGAYPDVRVVRTERNLGFAGGNDVALRGLRSRYAVLLNNDAVPEPGFVRTLVAALDAAPADVAALAATVLLAARFRAASPGDAGVVHGPDGDWVADPAGTVRLVNSTGNEVRTDGFGVDRGWLADAARHRPPADVFGFSGAAVALRRAALREVGLFDERFFMYYEDTDLSWRLRLAGYRVQHCPDAVVHHEHAASSGEGSPFFRFHDQRNRLAVLTKNASGRLLAAALLRYVLTTGSVGLRRGRWGEVAERTRVLASWLALGPHLLAERRRIGRRARVRRRDLEARLLVRPPARAAGAYRT